MSGWPRKASLLTTCNAWIYAGANVARRYVLCLAKLKVLLELRTNPRQEIELFCKTKKNPGRWGERPGWGTAEGGRRKLVCSGGFTPPFLIHLVHSQHANLAQFFVREIRLFFCAGNFFVAETGFARDAIQFL